jgi:hypothetical protein
MQIENLEAFHVEYLSNGIHDKSCRSRRAPASDCDAPLGAQGKQTNIQGVADTNETEATRR